MQADEKVCQMKILILHEHKETGETVSTEQIWKITVCCEKQVKGIHIAYEAPAKVVKDTFIS
jgi:hypothetical protein